MRKDKCAKCPEITEKMGGYDPDQGWLCPKCWEEANRRKGKAA